ncbi:hypothetical protein K438DRAFT_1779115 [Mycena galopus ATCC 62051]|nr:hypothetical protein K438DRAFT_1779115 [Mycena galopus ATCC 62051]
MKSFFAKKPAYPLSTPVPSYPYPPPAPRLATTAKILRSFGADSTNTIPPSFGKFASSEDFIMGFHPPTPASPTKRKKVSNPSNPNSPSKPDPKRQKNVHESLSIAEKLDKVFNVFDELGWSLGDFMVHVFAHRDVNRSIRHGTLVQRYLAGRNARCIAEVLELWLSSPDDAGYEQEEPMFSTTTPYTQIRHARAAFMSFAAQIVKTKLVKDIRAAVKITGGLHAPTHNKPLAEESTGKSAELATSLMQNMKAVIQSNQGLLYDYVLSLATPDVISRNGIITERRNRPPELVGYGGQSAHLLFPETFIPSAK